MGNFHLGHETRNGCQGAPARNPIERGSTTRRTPRPIANSRTSSPSGLTGQRSPLARFPLASGGTPTLADQSCFGPRGSFGAGPTALSVATAAGRRGIPGLRRLTLACAVWLSLAATSPEIAQASDPLVCEDVAGGSGYCDIVITPTIVFRAPAASIVFAPDRQSFDIDDDVTLTTPVGDLTLIGQFHFAYTGAGAEFPLEVTGSVRAPLADLPLFADATFRFEPLASIGIVSRDRVRQLLEGGGERLPLAENYELNENGEWQLMEPAYVFFHFESGLELDMPLGTMLGLSADAEDPFQFSVPGDKTVTFILDPADPYFYFTPDGQKANKVDKELLALQLRVADELDAMLASGQIADPARFEEALANILLLDEGQLAGLAMDMISNAGPDVDPQVMTRVEALSAETRVLYQQRKDPDALAYDQANPDQPPTDVPDNAADFAVPNIDRGKLADIQKAADEMRGKKTQSGEQEAGLGLPEINALAFSWLGGIPFVPETTWGLPEGIGGFRGQMLLSSTMPLSPVVELEGTVVSYVGQEGVELGGNGFVSVSVDLIPGFLSFGFPLGSASAGVRLLADEQASYFSGINHPDLSFLPPQIPFVPAQTSKVAGYVSTLYPEESFIAASGAFGYDLSGLREATGLPLNDLDLAKVQMRIDRNGVFARGLSDVSLHPSLKTAGSAEVETLVGIERPEDTYVRMSGNLQVAGVGLSPAMAEVDGNGLFVSGDFKTPLSLIRLTGNVTSRGPELTGTAAIDFPLGAITAAADKAHQQVLKAQQDLAAIDQEIARQRGIVQAERDRDAQAVAGAEAAVREAQATVDSLKSAIAREQGNIRTWKSQISSKYSWYNRQPWYKKASAYASYLAYAASKNASIAAAYTRIAAYETSLAAANLALSGAQQALAVTRQAIVTIPVDADPRVAGLFAARETAELALRAAEAALAAVPRIDGDLEAQIAVTLDQAGLSGRVFARLNGQTLQEGTVTFGAHPKACIQLAEVGEVCTAF